MPTLERRPRKRSQNVRPRPSPPADRGRAPTFTLRRPPAAALSQRASTSGVALAVTLAWGVLLGTTFEFDRGTLGPRPADRQLAETSRVTYLRPPEAVVPLPPPPVDRPSPLAPSIETPVRSALPRSPAPPRGVPPAAVRDTSGGTSAAGNASRVPSLRGLPLRPATVPSGGVGTAGAPGAAACVGPCAAPTVGTLERPAALPAAAQDSIRRAMGGDVARRAGPPVRPAGSIAVGLPGGGPSRAQRARDRSLHAAITAELDAFRQRRDSIRADSIRADSLRRARGGGS